MSNDYSNFDRRSARVEPAKRRPNNTFYLTIAGSAFLAALVGGLVVYALVAPRVPSQNDVVAVPVAPAAAPAQRGTAQAPAAAPVSWSTAGTYGAWQVRCQNGAAPKKICTAVLEVINKQSKTVMMAWIVAPGKNGALQTIFQTPTGVLVGSGIEVKFGNGNARHLNYISCQTRICTAVAPMDEAFVKEATGNAKANVTLYAANGKSVDFGIPVNGLDKAIAALKK